MLLVLGAGLIGAEKSRAGNDPAIAFPLSVDHNKRFLDDAAGRPVLITGEAAWSLIADLTREDAILYLDDRQRRGVNAILVNLVEKKFASHAPANAYGEQPFTGKAFLTPNPAYFDHAAWIIDRAQKAGMTVFLTPAYLGVNGGDEGWYHQVEAAGPDAMRAYGKTIARRFASFPNIVWVMGGDFDPSDQSLITSLAEGIQSVLPQALITDHGGRNSVPTTIWPHAAWLQINSVYDYDNVYQSVLDQTVRPQKMPVMLLETLYENERNTSAQTIRMNAYAAILAGAAGQFFGVSPVWHFGGPGVFGNKASWRTALDSAGMRSMQHLSQLFQRLAWYELLPDRDNAIAATTGMFAARMPDQSLAIIYGASDSGDGFVVNASAASRQMQALWFDPSSGAFFAARGADVGTGLVSYRPPAPRNDGNDTDWVLLIGSPERIAVIQKQ